MSTTTNKDTETARRKRTSAFRILLTSCVLLLLMITWGLFIRGSLRAMEVESGSMIPALEVKDRVIVWYHPVGKKDIQRGMIIVIDPPEHDGADLVKRIVGIPGDSIEFNNGKFTVNGAESQPPGGSSFRYLNASNQKTTLGKDEFFVMGDNREKSYDSEEFGPVQIDQIKGEVIYRYGPRGRMGFVD